MAVVGNLRVNLGLNSAAFDTGLNKAQGSVNSFASGATKAFVGLAAAAAAAFSVGALGGLADEWSDLNSRLTNATGSMENGAAAMNRLQEVARRSYSSISQTTEAFLSQSTTLNALGVSTDKQLDLTEALNNALVISATRGDKARSVMDAWGKAMALGELRGQNLNAVISGSDRLAQALADSMGVSVTELRNLGAQGKITREVMLGITDQLEALRTEAAEMPATLSDGFGILRDAVFQLVGRVDQATGASAGFATQLIAIGDAITSATGVIVRVSAVLAEIFSDAVAAAISLVSQLAHTMYQILSPAIGLIVENMSILVAAFAIFIAIKMVLYLGSVAAAMLTFARTVRVLGIVMAAVTSIARLKMTAILLLGAAIAEVTGTTEVLVGWISELGRTIYESLPEGIRTGLDTIGERLDQLLGAINEVDSTGAAAFRDMLDHSSTAAASIGNVGTAAQGTAAELQKMGDVGQQVTSKLAQGFTDLFEAAISGGKDLGEIVLNLIRDLGRMFLNQGFQALLGMGGGGLFGGLFGGLGKIFGFARGGTILPGGGGGIDSQLVMFRKSPTERVDITKPGQTLSAGGGIAKVEMTVTVDGARGNMEIQQMVTQGVAQGLKTVEKNIGNLMTDWQLRNA